MQLLFFRLFSAQLFRGETSLEQVRNAAEVATDGVDHLGLAFFSEVFQGLWHDAHGNEVSYLKSCYINK